MEVNEGQSRTELNFSTVLNLSYFSNGFSHTAFVENTEGFPEGEDGLLPLLHLLIN